MRKYIATAALAAAVIATPIAGLAATRQAPAAAKKEATSGTSGTAKAAPTHATKGVVKSVDDATLVITRHGKKPEDMTFTMNANTHKEGAVAVGAPVSVRYQENGTSHIATAVSVEQTKSKTSAKK
jgi:hypothetical protein